MSRSKTAGSNSGRARQGVYHGRSRESILLSSDLALKWLAPVISISPIIHSRSGLSESHWDCSGIRSAMAKFGHNGISSISPRTAGSEKQGAILDRRKESNQYALRTGLGKHSSITGAYPIRRDRIRQGAADP